MIIALSSYWICFSQEMSGWATLQAFSLFFGNVLSKRIPNKLCCGVNVESSPNQGAFSL